MGGQAGHLGDVTEQLRPLCPRREHTTRASDSYNSCSRADRFRANDADKEKRRRRPPRECYLPRWNKTTHAPRRRRTNRTADKPRDADELLKKLNTDRWRLAARDAGISPSSSTRSES